MEAKARRRKRKGPEGTIGQVTQKSGRQAGARAGPEGQDDCASPALDNGEDHLGTPCWTGGMGWRGRCKGKSFGLSNLHPPHLPLADKD